MILASYHGKYISSSLIALWQFTKVEDKNKHHESKKTLSRVKLPFRILTCHTPWFMQNLEQTFNAGFKSFIHRAV